MEHNPRRLSMLVIAVGLLFFVVLACSDTDTAPAQTAAAEMGQTALAEGKKAAGTEAAHLVETGQAAAATAAAHAIDTLMAGPAPQFLPPVSGAEISKGPWGPGDGDHNGPDLYAIDYLGPAGTPITPTLAGEVVFSGHVDDGYGYVVALRHQNSQKWNKIYYSIYAHMEGKGLPVVGTTVNPDTIIGYMSNSGTSTIHLHFAVRESGKLYTGTQALYGQSRPDNAPVIVYTAAFNVRAQFGLNP